jgi:hypothetical protein
MSANVKVVEQYLNYAPPVNVYRSVRLLLRYVPEQHLIGLHKVVLTNSETVRQQIRGKISSEKRRFRPADCTGLYSEGRILLLIDQIFLNYPEVLLLLPQFKTFVIGETLYHEIGHHIHRLEEPGYRSDKEVVADQWKEKLLQVFLVRRYWYLAKVVKVCAALLHPIALRLKRSRGTDKIDGAKA